MMFDTLDDKSFSAVLDALTHARDRIYRSVLDHCTNHLCALTCPEFRALRDRHRLVCEKMDSLFHDRLTRQYPGRSWKRLDRDEQFYEDLSAGMLHRCANGWWLLVNQRPDGFVSVYEPCRHWRTCESGREF